ncbi:MAG: phosphoribosylaminoimidazolecarboxamide formyltransferase [Gemmatimonadetes bacterium]|jgi:phosphoribosylaminoimidazolecarboxamide formyltransferase / IMP cyclohydrolase|nr:phosphoribosylaminoimidazolecarboxamide formyltransferase [Gemmatimonadota bacterium]
MGNHVLPLKYGCNPHQVPARISVASSTMPIEVLNGGIGYINMLDALNAWQLVRELKEALGLPAAASFKHVSPAGVAVGIPLSSALQKAYFVGDLELTELAAAYARARGADRMSSYGDWIALSDTVDVATARLIRREFSLGIIAPGYEPEAFSILREKSKGSYPIVEIDPQYEPEALECREVFGFQFEQGRNDLRMSLDLLENVVTARTELPDSVRRDMIVALVALKYTQSNSVCLAVDGQVVGMGAGQQSRIHCTRLAAAKGDTWYLRQHPAVLGLRFKPRLRRPARDNAIDQYLCEDLTTEEEKLWRTAFADVPRRLSAEEKRDWMEGLEGVVLGSDAYFPFRDSIDRGKRSGVEYVVQPGGSLKDREVVRACDEYGMAMVFSGVRLFHH